MDERYEIHGRIIERRSGVILRDETRLASAETLDAAGATARTFADDGMVVWVFEVRWETGRVGPTYRTVARHQPTPQRATPTAGRVA